ncbi:UNVERIFIED_CONTAM: hypothetical protein FKN15_061055 [Acipenser sinensis]
MEEGQEREEEAQGDRNKAVIEGESNVSMDERVEDRLCNEQEGEEEGLSGGGEWSSKEEDRTEEADVINKSTPQPSWFPDWRVEEARPEVVEWPYFSWQIQPSTPRERLIGNKMWGRQEPQPKGKVWPYFPSQIQATTHEEKVTGYGLWSREDGITSLAQAALLTRKECNEEALKFEEAGPSGAYSLTSLCSHWFQKDCSVEEEESEETEEEYATFLLCQSLQSGRSNVEETKEELQLSPIPEEPDETLYLELWDFGEEQGDLRYGALWVLLENGIVVNEAAWLPPIKTED